MRTIKLTGALLAVALLLASCANGPKYGAARKHKKSCDCPHFNAVPMRDYDVHASLDHGRGD